MSRTGDTTYLRNRATVLATAQANGLTNCPGYETRNGHHPCGIELDYTTPQLPNSAETDHITPAAQGGNNTTDNLRVICRTCNQKRNRKPPPPPPTTYHTGRAW